MRAEKQARKWMQHNKANVARAAKLKGFTIQGSRLSLSKYSKAARKI